MDSKDLKLYVDDRPAEGVFRVHPDVYTDPQLFELEQTYVFERTWNFLGLESQIPKPHDYIVAYIGRLPVLVMRDGEGRIGAFLNVCRHKGNLLVRNESGNRKFHTCQYHGWAFDSSGRLADIKDRGAGAYSPAFEADDHDLVRLAALATYKGLVFGSVSRDVPPLADFLGDLRFFLDLAMEQGPHGMEFVPGRIMFTYDGNWKAQADNGTDFYHLTSTHTSFMEVQRRRADLVSGNQAARQFDWQKRFAQRCGTYTFRHGHNAIWMDQPEPAKRPVYWTLDEVKARVGALKADWMVRTRNITVFPGMQIADSTSLLIRTFRPLAVDRTEMTIYCLAPRGESDRAREIRIRQYEDFFNSTGLATPDDTTCYEDCQVGYGAHSITWQQGYARGMTAVREGADAAAHSIGIQPVTSQQGPHDMQDETIFHAGYREWVRLLKNGLSQESRVTPLARPTIVGQP